MVLAAGVDVATIEEVLESSSDEVDVALPTSIATGGGVGAELLDISSVLFVGGRSATVDITGGGVELELLGISSVLLAANIATGGGVGFELLVICSVLFAEGVTDTVDITEVEVVNAEGSEDVVGKPNNDSQNDGVEVVVASVVLSGDATAVSTLR